MVGRRAAGLLFMSLDHTSDAMTRLILTLFIAHILVGTSSAQFSAFQISPQDAATMQALERSSLSRYAPAARSAAESRFKLVFKQDQAQAFSAGVELYATPPGWDGAAGRRHFVTWVLDTTAAGTLTTFYNDPISRRPAHLLEDTGFKDFTRATSAVNMQVTGSSALEHVVLYSTVGIGPDLPVNTTLMRIHDGASGDLLFRGVAGRERIYYVARSFSESDQVNFDLNGNGLQEIIGLGSIPGFFEGRRMYVYDDFEVIDSLDDRRSPFMQFHASTTNDLNQDGRPELLLAGYEGLFSSAPIPRFYQWDADSSGFVEVGAIGGTKTYWGNPVNLDGDEETEIFALGGLLGDSLLIYGSDFRQEWKIKPPGYAKILRYFLANVNETPNDEIIVVQSIPHPVHIFATGTIIYDLSTGVEPIRIDSTFETLAVADLRASGTTDLLGARLNGRNGTFGVYGERSLELMTPSEGYAKQWNVSDPAVTFTTLSGPFGPTDDTIAEFFFSIGYNPLNPLSQADFNGDGVRDFVIETFAPGGLYGVSGQMVVDAHGNVLGTLPEAVGSSKILAYDFNGNGRDELLVSHARSAIRDDDTTRVWLYEWDGEATSAESEIPSNFTLEQNYPNPFNPATNLSFSLRGSEHVRLVIYDVLGRTVDVLLDDRLAAGRHEVSFDASGLPSGAYFYRLEAGKDVATRRMMLLR